MDREAIKPQQTYRSQSGLLYYVQDLCGQKVTFNKVGSVDRFDASLGRFAARMQSEVPNQ